MERTEYVFVSTTPLLKREDCKRTNHDSDFSQWKILIGPCDWEDHLLNKEGAERYRTHNLPNCFSCPGVYELGIVVSLPNKEGTSSSNLGSKSIIPVYLGQADNVRTRLQQYGRDGAHLENGWSNGEQDDRKVLGLFSDIFSHGVGIAYRWVPMESKKDAEKTESQLLKTYDYAWNRGMNRRRRPADIHLKLEDAASNAKRVPLAFNKLHFFHPKKAGISIKHCDSPVLENGSSFYIKQEGTNILPRIINFSLSRPILVSKEHDINNNDTSTCGVALGYGSICTRPPVEGRKRCADHKGMKVNAAGRPCLPANTENIPRLTCGVTLDDASVCTRVPVAGRIRCEEHKGMRIGRLSPPPLVAQEKHYTPSSGLDLGLARDSNWQKSWEEYKGVTVKPKVLDNRDGNCVATTFSGFICGRKAGEGSKFCWQHEEHKRIMVQPNVPCKREGGNCAATILSGSICSRKACEGSRFCWQHEERKGMMGMAKPKVLYYRYGGGQCAATTRSGSSCRRTAGEGSMFCWQHG